MIQVATKPMSGTARLPIPGSDSTAFAAVRQSLRDAQGSPGIDVSAIDPIMFAQYLADEAKRCPPEDGTLRFTLMVASALIAQFAEESNR